MYAKADIARLEVTEQNSSFSELCHDTGQLKIWSAE